jgi:hypothetical protein
MKPGGDAGLFAVRPCFAAELFAVREMHPISVNELNETHIAVAFVSRGDSKQAL